MPSLPPGVNSEKVEDVGDFVNNTDPETPYMHGLDGVNLYLNWVFVNCLLVSFFGAAFIVMVSRLVHLAWRRLHGFSPSQDPPRSRPRWRQWIMTNIVLAPLGKHRYSQELRIWRNISLGSIPPRLFVILLVLYVISNTMYCAMLDYKHKNTAQLLAELRGRSGALAVANLVPATLFALRNNFLIPLMGISYNTCNRIHRWTARVAIAEILVHCSCWFTNAVRAGGIRQVGMSLRTSVSYRSGFGAGCCFIMIALFTLYPVRHASYETFLVGHRALVLLGLLGAYMHLAKADLAMVLPYVQVCIALWAAEWAIRWGRVLYFNFNPRSPQRAGTVVVEALPGEACRLTFFLARPWKWRPGCHVHVYIPSIAWWSSHPFSIAWGQGVEDVQPTISIEKYKYPKAWAGVQNVYMIAKALESGDSIEYAKHKQRQSELVTSVSLVVRARSGMTRRMYQKASASPDRTFVARGFVEGPYGGVHSLVGYQGVVLFAGGVGITHCLGVAQDLLRRRGASAGRGVQIRLVWTVADAQALHWAWRWLEELCRMDEAGQFLRIDIYVSRAAEKIEFDMGRLIRCHTGRCDPGDILDTLADKWMCPIAVNVCGPAALSDGVRAVVRRHRGAMPLHFVEEAFTY